MSRWADEVDEEERRSSGNFSYGGRSTGPKTHPGQNADYADYGSGFTPNRYNAEPDWRERQYRAPQGTRGTPQRGFHPTEERSNSWRSSQSAASHPPEGHATGHRVAPTAGHRPPDPADSPAVNTSKPIKILKRQTSESQPSTPASSSHASSLPEHPGSVPSAPPPIRTEHHHPIPQPALQPHDLPPGYESRPPPQPAAGTAPTPPRHPDLDSPTMHEPPPNWQGGPPPMPVQAPKAGSQPSTPTAADIAMLQMQQQQQYMQMQAYMQYTLQMQQAHYQNALLQQKQYYEALLQQMQAAHAASSGGSGEAAGGERQAAGEGDEGQGEQEGGADSPGHDAAPPGFASHPKPTTSEDGAGDILEASNGRARKVKQGFQTYAPPTTRSGTSTPPPGGLPAPGPQGSGDLGPGTGPLFQHGAGDKGGLPGSGGPKSRFQYSEDENPSRIVASMHDDGLAALAAGRAQAAGGAGGAGGREVGEQAGREEGEWGARGGGVRGRAAAGSRQSSEPASGPRGQAPARTDKGGPLPEEHPSPRGRPGRIRTGQVEVAPPNSGSTTPPPGGFRKGAGGGASRPIAANGSRSTAPAFTPPRPSSFTTPRPTARTDGPASAFAAAALRAALPSADGPPSKGPSNPTSPPTTPRPAPKPASPRRRRSSRRSSSPHPAATTSEAAAALNGTSLRGGSFTGKHGQAGGSGMQEDGPPGFGGSDAAQLGDGSGNGRKPRSRPPRQLYTPPKKLGGPESAAGAGATAAS